MSRLENFVLVSAAGGLSLALLAGVACASDGCRFPYVWREAFAADHVCVAPELRSQARADNAAAASRINPTNHDYGPDTCIYGYVWREASPADHVCVRPDVRAEVRRDNAAAPGRYASAGGSPHPGVNASFNPAWQAAPGDRRCCPHNLLVCPLGRHWC